MANDPADRCMWMGSPTTKGSSRIIADHHPKNMIRLKSSDLAALGELRQKKKKANQIKRRSDWKSPGRRRLEINPISSPVIIELPGPPVGKGRPRFSRHGFAYTPSKTRAYEARLAGAAQRAMRGREPLYGPLKAVVWAFMPVAASWSAKRRDAALAGVVRPTGRPDWDNLAKITDALNGIVWIDDSQVVEGSVVKRYSESPRFRIEISPIPPPLLSGDSDDDDRQARLDRHGRFDASQAP